MSLEQDLTLLEWENRAKQERRGGKLLELLDYSLVIFKYAASVASRGN